MPEITELTTETLGVDHVQVIPSSELPKGSVRVAGNYYNEDVEEIRRLTRLCRPRTAYVVSHDADGIAYAIYRLPKEKK